MSRLKAALSAIAVMIAFTATAGAETRTFLIENTSGYGVDRCLARGEPCGEAVASAYCRSRAFDRATTFRLARAEEFSSVNQQPCRGFWCTPQVAITCER